MCVMRVVVMLALYLYGGRDHLRECVCVSELLSSSSSSSEGRADFKPTVCFASLTPMEVPDVPKSSATFFLNTTIT